MLVEGPRPDGHGGVLFSDVVAGGVHRWTPDGVVVTACPAGGVSAGSCRTPTAAWS